MLNPGGLQRRLPIIRGLAVVVHVAKFIEPGRQRGAVGAVDAFHLAGDFPIGADGDSNGMGLVGGHDLLLPLDKLNLNAAIGQPVFLGGVATGAGLGQNCTVSINLAQVCHKLTYHILSLVELADNGSEFLPVP